MESNGDGRACAGGERSAAPGVIACLEAAVRAAPVDPETLLARIRGIRARPRGARLTDRLLTRLKAAGRP